MRLICTHVTVQNMVILHQDVVIHLNVSLFIVSIERTAQTCFRIFSQTRIMVDGAKFNRYDSGGLFLKSTFKNGCCRKNSVSL